VQVSGDDAGISAAYTLIIVLRPRMSAISPPPSHVHEQLRSMGLDCVSPLVVTPSAAEIRLALRTLGLFNKLDPHCCQLIIVYIHHQHQLLISCT